jgi:vancomycin permeability regulator SanA
MGSRNVPMRFKSLIQVSLILAAVAVLGVITLRAYSAWQAQGQIYSFDTVPARPVAIVFGAQVLPSGRLSAMLADRVKVGAQLYQAGKGQGTAVHGRQQP